MINFECPKCGKNFILSDKYAGKKAKCMCNEVINIPNSSHKNTLSNNSEKITKKCPFCDALIPAEAVKCNRCGKIMVDIHANTAIEQPLINLKTTTISDKFLRLSFKFAKGVSVIIVAICFINLIGSGILFFLIKPKIVQVSQQLSLPNISEFKQQVEIQRAQQNSQNASDYTQHSVSPSQSIESQFGVQLYELRTKYGLIERQTLISWLGELQNKNRILFLSGLNTFLADAGEYNRQSQRNFSYKSLADYYHEAFKQAEQQYEEDVASALAHNKSETERIYFIRKLILMSFMGSIGCLLAFLILPLLIQIERNTRVLLAEK